MYVDNSIGFNNIAILIVIGLTVVGVGIIIFFAIRMNRPKKHHTKNLHSYYSTETINNMHLSNAQAVDSFVGLEKLAELRDKGVLTKEDYETKKNELLDRI